MGNLRLKSWLDAIDDDMGFIDVFSRPVFTRTWKGQWVDTDKFDIVPRKSYVDELLKEKDREIEYHEEKIKVLKEEKTRILNQKQEKNE